MKVELKNLAGVTIRLALCRLMIQLSLVTALSSFSHEALSLEQERLHWDNEEVCSFCCDMEQLCVSFREKNGLTSWQFCNFRFWYNEPLGRGTRFDREHAPFFPVQLARFFFVERKTHTCDGFLQPAFALKKQCSLKYRARKCRAKNQCALSQINEPGLIYEFPRIRGNLFCIGLFACSSANTWRIFKIPFCGERYDLLL